MRKVWKTFSVLILVFRSSMCVYNLNSYFFNIFILFTWFLCIFSTDFSRRRIWWFMLINHLKNIHSQLERYEKQFPQQFWVFRSNICIFNFNLYFFQNFVFLSDDFYAPSGVTLYSWIWCFKLINHVMNIYSQLERYEQQFPHKFWVFRSNMCILT